MPDSLLRSAKPPLIMIVDDEPTTIKVIASALSEQGRLSFATSGEQAIERAITLKPDIILLDVMMPGIDGYEVCRRLKADERTRATPVIFVTSLDDSDDEVRGLEVGAIDYLYKPIRPAIVKMRVSNHLKLKLYQDQLEHLSLNDALTGIPNRRHLDRLLLDEWRRAQRGNQTLSVALVDIDHFKRFNDTYGHAAGDVCLKAVAQQMAGSLYRAGDFLARYGGEEFCAVLAATNSQGAIIVAERLREGISRLEVAVPGQASPVKVTISLGVATMLPTPTLSPALLLRAADDALYAAKASGRNCVRTLPVATSAVSSAA